MPKSIAKGDWGWILAITVKGGNHYHIYLALVGFAGL